MSLLGDGALSACGVKSLRTRRPGRLTVAAGQAWVTRLGDLDDHVLGAGQAVVLRANEQVVVEPWVGGSPVHLAWRSDQPRALAWRGFEALAAAGLRAFAALRGAAVGRAAARKAAASDKRTQGSIERGESSASSGAVQ
jgi:hypothetical protein